GGGCVDERAPPGSLRYLGRRPAEPRCVEPARRIVAAQAIGQQETVELTDRRQPSRQRTRRQTPYRCGREVIVQRRRLGTVERYASPGEKPRQIEQIVAVGGQGGRSHATLRREHLEKCLEARRYRDDGRSAISGSAHRAKPSRSASAAP